MNFFQGLQSFINFKILKVFEEIYIGGLSLGQEARIKIYNIRNIKKYRL